MDITAPNPKTYPTSSRLLQDMRLGAAIRGDSELTAVRDSIGAVELMAVAPSGEMYNLRRSSTSDTGWDQTGLANSFSATTIAVGVNGSEVVAFAGGTNEALPEIHFSTRADDGSWNTWTQVDQKNAPNGLTVVRLIAMEASGSIVLFAFLQVGPGAPNSGELSLWSIPWEDANQAWLQIGSPDSAIAAPAKLKTAGAGVLAFERSQRAPTTFDLYLYPASPFGKKSLIVAGTTASHLTSGLQANGYSGVFLNELSWTTGDTTLTFIDGSATDPQAASMPTHQQTTGCSQLLAADASQTPLTLFLLDDEHHLFVIRQSTDGSWREPFELGDAFASITQACDAQNQTEIFGFDLQDSLRHLWEDGGVDNPTSWHEAQIDLPLDKIQDVPSYSTRITLHDSQGNVLPNTEASLFAGEIVPAVVNGRSVVLGNQAAVSVKTDASGTLSVYSATEDLNTAKLRLVTTDGNDTHIQRNAHSQKQLAEASVDDIKGLLPSRYQPDAEQVQQAVQRSMTAVYGQAIREDSFEDKIDVSLLADDFDFRFDVRDGRATFTELTGQESADLIQHYAVGGIHWTAFWNWLGDIVESAEHAIESAFTYVVKKVEEGIHLVVDVVIRGVQYVYSGVIQYVEEAFSVVTSIFSSVEVFFSNLYKFVGWLVTDSAKDIWNTKSAMSAAMTSLFPTLTGLISQGEAHVETFFDHLIATVDQKFDDVIAKIGDTTFDYAKQAALATTDSTGPLDVAQDNSAISNWFFDKLASPNGGVAFTPAIPASIVDAAKQMLTSVSGDIGNSVKQQFTEFGNFLQRVAENPSDFMALAAKEVLTQIKLLLDAVLKVAKDIAVGLLRFSQVALNTLEHDVLSQKLDGFFITGIYNYINPGEDETPTVLDLISLFAAVPSTVLFVLLQGHPPYTDADIREMNASGLGPAAHHRVHGLAADNPLAGSGLNVPGYLAGLLMIPFTVLEVGGDATTVPTETDDINPESVATVVIGLIGGIGLPCLMLGLASPEFKWDTNEDIWINMNWCAWFGPVFVNIVTGITTGFQKMGPDSATFIWPYSVSGLFVLAIGIVALVYEEDRDFWMGWLNIALPFPTILKPLLLIEHPIPRVVLVAVDGVCDLGAALSGMKLAGRNTQQTSLLTT